MALLGGLCLVGGIPLPAGLRVAILFLAAPVLIVGAAIILALEWRNADLDRWGRVVCTAGVATYLVFLLALVAGGDVEGGIPVGAQAFWQALSAIAMVSTIPMLIAGGALVLLRSKRQRLA